MGVGHVTSGHPLDTYEAVGYRAGILGTGFMGRVHAHAIRVTGGQVVGVVASTPERSRAAADEFAAERAASDADELIDADDIDVIHVCTPNHLHESQALAALKAGKHVVCEKPLATTVAAAAELAATAADVGRIATVPFVYRFHPMVREARERVARGDLGRVALAHGSYLQDWLLLPSDDNWRVDPQLGGPSRAFADIGSHWCDLLEFVTGDRIDRVSAQSSTVIPERGGRAVTTEDVVTLQFATTAGVVGTAVISQISAGRKNRLFLEVSGSAGTVAFDQEQPELLWRGDRQHSALLVRDPDTLSPAAARYARVPAGHAQGYQDCFNAIVADTRAAIAGEVPDGLPTFDDGLRGARIAEAVLASIETGQWVQVQP
jgi:predicted dehydrogenase